MRKRKKAESYLEMLRDPRWQRARLDTMQRAGFACERCGDKETTLNVHHKNYKRDHAPWEYELSNFVCLCRDCHEIVHKQKEMINNLLPYAELNVGDFVSGLVAHQVNRKVVGGLHPRQFANNKDFFLGGVASIFYARSSDEFIENLVELLTNDNFCKDLNSLYISYMEAEHEH